MVKRIIVCCDGTSQDGVVMKERWQFTNILRLARTIQFKDTRCNPPIPQIVLYQAGIGSENNFYAQYLQNEKGRTASERARELYGVAVQTLEGMTGAPLAAKVQEAYGFIADNYEDGDELFLFGFSRGAYTARMIAAFIGEIGVLDRKDMDHFGNIFIAFQKLGKTNDPTEQAALNKQLDPWRQPGKKRPDSSPTTFSIKCVGVFDTVSSLGLPEEISVHAKSIRTIFGFSDTFLGEHIQTAFQALALNERRADFNCVKFEQTSAGLAKGQTLRQCWFSGVHTDIGGGYHDHDLSDMSLNWMAANISNMLSLDFEYLGSLPEPVFPWGQQPIHNSRQGIYSISKTLDRTLPTITDTATHETIHSSVLQQPDSRLPPGLKQIIITNPCIVCKLLPLEVEMRGKNVYIPGKYKSIPESEILGRANAGVDIMSLARQVMKKAIGHVRL